MAASWKRTRLGKQQVAVSSSNTAVEDLARCSSDMHDRAVRGRARTPRGRAYTSEYWRRAARWLLIEHVMIEPSAGARGRRAASRTAVQLYTGLKRLTVTTSSSARAKCVVKEWRTGQMDNGSGISRHHYVSSTNQRSSNDRAKLGSIFAPPTNYGSIGKCSIKKV